jgi:hypothetical protein
MIDVVVSDRAAAISALDGDELARRIALQPHLAAWCVGTGPLRVWLGSSTRSPGRKQLAGALANPHVLRLTIELLDGASLQLLVVMASRGGSLTEAEFDQELEPVADDERHRMVATLVDRFLVHEPEPGRPLSLRAGVAEMVSRPGRPLDRLMLDQTITKQHLGIYLENLGIDRVPASKTDRIEALRDVIGRPEPLLALVSAMSPGEQEMFERLVAAGGRGISGDRLTNNWWQLRLYSPVDQRPIAIRPSLTPQSAALQRFIDIGLVWVEREIRHVGLWLETITAVNGRTFARWPEIERHAVRPLDHHAPMHPDALSTLQSLLRQVATEPIPGLKSGGIGVKAIRDLAKRMGWPVEHISPLVHLALGLGLITQMSEFVGRGRNANWVHRYEVSAERSAEWRRLSIADQWVQLVDAWLDGLDVPGETRSLESVLRRQIIADLLALPDGHGIPQAELVAWCQTQHLLAGRLDLEQLHPQLITLGLCPANGPVGLGALARTVLTEPASLHQLLPEQDLTFVVQADYSVIAPPALDPAVRSRLDRLCTAESSGSVAVLRLDRSRIAAEMAAGETAQSVLDFLTENSSVPVAPVVAQMLADVERQRGGLSARSSATIVTADDVLGLAAAVKVRSARLTLIAPTVAVSDLSLDKVMSALRKAGLAPSSSDEPPPPSEVISRVQPRAKTRNVPDVLHPHLAQLEALMEGW